ncbi:MAG: pantoate--beta-alanine ligase [Deltaproteobacteria bacterium]|nr:pantoate--beta-alanine ligase [Deltaproteobacteria bacterium]
MKVIKLAEEIQKRSDSLIRDGKKIGFVPTMGFLHEGHLKLLKECRKKCDDLILSIFVNPTQFSADEDLEAYPSDLKKDLELAEKCGVDAVFTPTKDSLYPENYETYVTLESLPHHLCGLSRPIHFRGVATIVTKLFNIVKPQVAAFGEKDFQQLSIIRRMVKDLNFDIEIIGVPIVREDDGLAMSSRNSYLSVSQRKTALILSKAIELTKKAVSEGKISVKELSDDMEDLINSKPETDIDYITFSNPDTLNPVTEITEETLLALAVKVGETRLIDNCVLKP